MINYVCMYTLKSRRTQNESLFENEQSVVVTAHGDRHRAMFNKFLFTKINVEDIGNIWFQQDGATLHTAEVILHILRRVFEDRIINRIADFEIKRRRGVEC